MDWLDELIDLGGEAIGLGEEKARDVVRGRVDSAYQGSVVQSYVIKAGRSLGAEISEGVASGTVPQPIEPPDNNPDSWMMGLVRPILDDFEKGVKETAKPGITEALLPMLAAVGIIGGLGGYFLGRRSR